GGGERGFDGGEEVGEAFEDGHLGDEFVGVGDVGWCRETDSGENWVTDWGLPVVAVVLRPPFERVVAWVGVTGVVFSKWSRKYSVQR
ncbi:unnamed protein product, partial [Ilex paraguariensis]